MLSIKTKANDFNHEASSYFVVGSFLHVSENLGSDFFAVIENVFELFLDVECVGDGAAGTEGHDVAHTVDEADAFWDFGDFVVVIPDLVGTYTLLIDEGVLLAYVLKFAQPCLLAEKGDADFVFDEQTIGHFLRNLRDDLKGHVVGRDCV